jgi:uncharacterized protein (DUF924 family)
VLSVVAAVLAAQESADVLNEAMKTLKQAISQLLDQFPKNAYKPNRKVAET